MMFGESSIMNILRNMLAEVAIKDTNSTNYAFEGINLENEVLELTDEYNEIISCEEAIERLEDIHAGLESLLEISENSLDDGGLTQSAAHIMRISTEALVFPLGITAPILSQESFGSSGERLTSTRISIEEEKGTLKKIWDAIVAASKALASKVNKWYEGIFNAAPKMLEKNIALIKTVGSLKKDDLKGEVKKSFSFKNLLSKGQPVSEIRNNMLVLKRYVSKFLDHSNIKETIDDVLTSIKGVNPADVDESLVKKIKADMDDVLKEYVSMIGSDNTVPDSMKEKDSTVKRYELFTGNRTLYSYYVENDVAKCRWAVGKYTDDGDLSKKSEISVDKVDLGFLKEVLEINSAVLKEVDGYKKSYSELKKYKKDIQDVGQSLLDKVKDDKKQAKFVKECFPVLKSLDKMIDNPNNALVAHSFKTATSLMSMASVVVKSYSPEKATVEAEAETATA